MCGEGEGESEEWFPSAIITPRLTARPSLSYLPGILLPFFLLCPICLSSLHPPSLFPGSYFHILSESMLCLAPALPISSIHSSILVSFFSGSLHLRLPRSLLSLFFSLFLLFSFFLFSLNAFLSRSFCVLLTLSPAYFYPPPNDPLLCVCVLCRACMWVCTCASQLELVNEGPLQCQTCCVQSMLLPVTHIVYEYIRLVNNPPFSCSLSLLLLLLPYVSLYLQTPRLF